jgi:hypothetical protein
MSTMIGYIRIAATVFPRDMVCLGNISVDTLHKGDTEDDYDDDNNNNNNNNGTFCCCFFTNNEMIERESS